MKPWLKVVLVVVIVVVIGVAVYYGGGFAARGALKARCDALKQQIADAQKSGADANALAAMQAQLQTCLASAQQAGLNVNAAQDSLASCQQNLVTIAASASDLASTSQIDPLKRTNIFNNIVHVGSDMVGCMQSVADAATTKEDLLAVHGAVLNAGTKMRKLQNDFYYSSHGTSNGYDRGPGQIGEPSGDDKAAALKTSVVDPLWGLLSHIDSRLHDIDTGNATVNAELPVLSANTSPPANSLFGP